MEHESKQSPLRLVLVGSLVFCGAAIGVIATFRSDDGPLGPGSDPGRSRVVGPVAIAMAPQASATSEDAVARPQVVLGPERPQPTVQVALPGEPDLSPDAVAGRPPGARLGDAQEMPGTGVSVLRSLPPGNDSQAASVTTASPSVTTGDLQVMPDGVAAMRTLLDHGEQRPDAMAMPPVGDVQVMPETGTAIMRSLPDSGQASTAVPMPPGTQENMLRAVPGTAVRVLQSVAQGQTRSQPTSPGKP
jgi:hypothetical protein